MASVATWIFITVDVFGENLDPSGQISEKYIADPTPAACPAACGTVFLSPNGWLKLNM